MSNAVTNEEATTVPTIFTIKYKELLTQRNIQVIQIQLYGYFDQNKGNQEE